MVPLCAQCGEDLPDNFLDKHVQQAHGLNQNPPHKQRVCTFLTRMGADAFLSLHPWYWIVETPNGVEVWRWAK